MSNQIIQWSMLLLPWLTLLLMNREDVKRFAPVGVLSALTGAIIGEIGGTLHFWGIGESVFPFSHSATFAYGAIPVTSMWVFKFTYGRFWLYLITNAILDLGFAYIILPWFVSIGILSFLRSSLNVYIINWGHQILLYGYQIWQEGIFVKNEKASRYSNLKPAAAKPLPQSEDNHPDKDD